MIIKGVVIIFAMLFPNGETQLESKAFENAKCNAPAVVDYIQEYRTTALNVGEVEYVDYRCYGTIFDVER